jgi:hypothetical protein
MRLSIVSPANSANAASQPMKWLVRSFMKKYPGICSKIIRVNSGAQFISPQGRLCSRNSSDAHPLDPPGGRSRPSILSDGLKEQGHQPEGQQDKSNRDEWESGGHATIMPRIGSLPNRNLSFC